MNFEQNIEKNRLKIKKLPERKIGEKKSKIGSSLTVVLKTVSNILILASHVSHVAICPDIKNWDKTKLISPIDHNKLPCRQLLFSCIFPPCIYRDIKST